MDILFTYFLGSWKSCGQSLSSEYLESHTQEGQTKVSSGCLGVPDLGRSKDKGMMKVSFQATMDLEIKDKVIAC